MDDKEERKDFERWAYLEWACLDRSQTNGKYFNSDAEIALASWKARANKNAKEIEHWKAKFLQWQNKAINLFEELTEYKGVAKKHNLDVIAISKRAAK